MQRDQQEPADHWLPRFQRFEATLSGIAGRVEGLDRFEQLLGGISERVASLVSAQDSDRRFISERGRCRRRWGKASSRRRSVWPAWVPMNKRTSPRFISGHQDHQVPMKVAFVDGRRLLDQEEVSGPTSRSDALVHS